MDIARQVRRASKRLLFGSESFPQFCPIALRDPQSEVSVWFDGLGAPRDFTCNNVIASTRPFTIGIGLEDQGDAEVLRRGRPALKFQERGGENRLLGKISLRLKEVIPLEGEQLCLFEAHNYENYCLPKPWLWMRYLYYAYERWHSGKRSNAPIAGMPVRDVHCLFVSYICPRPVVLVTVVDGNASNIVPMDLIGPIGARHFSLALHSTSTAAPLLERSRRVALSSIPAEQTEVAYKLGKNHKEASVDWEQLPFATTPSGEFGFPVPRFSLRVREMQVEAVRTLAGYKLFLATIIADRCWADGPQFFLIPGFYQSRREQARR
jgi:flavin reductase (DIM6/NTAB) family NADH-FMN oxidoreductase RutF